MSVTECLVFEWDCGVGVVICSRVGGSSRCEGRVVLRQVWVRLRGVIRARSRGVRFRSSIEIELRWY